jgi:phage replication initiation protein
MNATGSPVDLSIPEEIAFPGGASSAKPCAADLSTARPDACARTDGTQGGGASPRLVTRGETFSSRESLKNSLSDLALIDWFAFTIKPPEGCGLPWIFRWLVELFQIPEMTPAGKGWFGYKHKYDLGGFGLLAHGGKKQKGTIHVELTGTGCARVSAWHKVKEWGERHGVTITRLDLAHDDFEGKTVSIDAALEWWEAGLFAANGRPPDGELIDDLGSGRGKTLYIGDAKRRSGKLCRVYEKGRQLGDPSSPWARVEVEWRNRSRVIPWDAIINPGHYLAGAYPCLAFLSEVQEKIRTISKAVTVSYKRMVENARQMFGKLVNVMMQVHGGDAFAVVNELKRDGVPGRLENYADFLPQIFDGGGNAALVD